ncbi:hypothetical protein TrRE_jg5005 [Triparma retinervis]|uniref:Uncharacterized protein n=1 Tax=Triparma retinervis TaxID=2557542 RepID=A0A9W7L7X7_9STRA|nr:hypothetical protein TrRE_jg5005 [Triparma retinervis]
MVAEMVETTFVNACMQLSTGYVDVLKLFIVAAKAGYELGMTIPQLQLELSSCKSQTAGRPLLAEEVELRSIWISLVYLTLERVSHLKTSSSLGDTVDPAIRQKFYTFVYDVVNAHKQGYTLQTLKLENLVRSGAEEGGEVEEAGKSEQDKAIEKAILSQSMRLVFLTLTVLEEEALANEGGTGDANPPKPPIPGT